MQIISHETNFFLHAANSNNMIKHVRLLQENNTQNKCMAIFQFNKWVYQPDDLVRKINTHENKFLVLYRSSISCMFHSKLMDSETHSCKIVCSLEIQPRLFGGHKIIM